MNDSIIRVMLLAGKSAAVEIRRLYQGMGSYDTFYKSDSSPVTTADYLSNEIICSTLMSEFPSYALLTEESADELDTDGTPKRLKNPDVFIIDPIDGTDEFMKRSNEFCVSIGYAHDHKVVCGAVIVPAYDIAYYAVEGRGAYKITEFSRAFTKGTFRIGMGEKLKVSDRTDHLIMANSRSHPDANVDRLIEINKDKIERELIVGSCLKGCMIAEGKADIYVKLQPVTKEWDTAGMQIICEEAGATFTDKYGRPLPANRVDVYNTDGFIIMNHPESALKMDEVLGKE